MIPVHAEDGVLVVCTAACVAGLVGLWLLRNSKTRMSRWLDSIDPGQDDPTPTGGPR